jgi:hypothetical protein
MASTLTNWTDVLAEVSQALGEFAADHDVEAIARAAFEWTIDRDEQGNELLNTARFEQTVTSDEFWAIVERTA